MVVVDVCREGDCARRRTARAVVDPGGTAARLRGLGLVHLLDDLQVEVGRVGQVRHVAQRLVLAADSISNMP
jgi:hypothetical protein